MKWKYNGNAFDLDKKLETKANKEAKKNKNDYRNNNWRKSPGN